MIQFSCPVLPMFTLSTKVAYNLVTGLTVVQIYHVYSIDLTGQFSKTTQERSNFGF